ncbi:MAG: Tm-1-like ATP-binding domain-containing protein [Rhodobacteraceae bacterium]|nr:Tm-1-like ATP-binding domain-containing protein [Paracoccaceae bacterium]
MATQVLILATLETKEDEVGFLMQELDKLGVAAHTLDISLATGGSILNGDQKRHAMEAVVVASLGQIDADVGVVIGLGGGTGGEIALNILRALPLHIPKVLVTTLPFDPRAAVADSSITLVPTLADICGLNSVLRDVLENTALMVAGLCRKSGAGRRQNPAVGITALGATDGAVLPLVQALACNGRESAVFHSNGYGGAAFSRFAARGDFEAIVDVTPHEITRVHLAGAHVEMPLRFSAGADLPRVVLPGAMNFLGLGALSEVPDHYRDRPHYAHSGFFTHVQLTEDEMQLVATRLADTLNAVSGPTAVIIPMGGFSHQDRPGGAIENQTLRDVLRVTLHDQLTEKTVIRTLDAHLFDPVVTQEIITTLDHLTDQKDLP